MTNKKLWKQKKEHQKEMVQAKVQETIKVEVVVNQQEKLENKYGRFFEK